MEAIYLRMEEKVDLIMVVMEVVAEEVGEVQQVVDMAVLGFNLEVVDLQLSAIVYQIVFLIILD